MELLKKDYQINTRRITSLISLILIVSFNCLAQTSTVQPEQDVVILKDGTKVFGIIIKNEPDQMIRLRTSEGLFIDVMYSEVKEITFGSAERLNFESEVIPNKRGLNVPGHGLFLKSKGEINVGIFNPRRVQSTAISAIVGFRLNEQVALGAGIGAQRLESNLYLSSYGEMVVYFLKKSATPYISFKFGHLNTFYNYGPDSFHLNSSLGVRLPSKQKAHWHLFIGFDYISLEVQSLESRDYGLFSVGTGIEF